MSHDDAATPAEHQSSREQYAEALSLQAPASVTKKARDAGDAWVEGVSGRFWGNFGAAGVLAYDPGKGVLLQHRAIWSDHGGTWGLPGGALHQDEDVITGALREAAEEAALPADRVEVLFTSILDVGYWSYTTVVVRVREPFDPVISDPESLDLQWIPVEQVSTLQLHPGFAASWRELRAKMLKLAAQ